MIKIALIDDHIVVRSGFAQLLTLEPDISIVGQYASAQEAWPHLISLDIDVAIMDISMPDESGLQLLTRLRKKKPDFRTIILSIYDTPAFVQSALDAGASAYLTKCCGPEELVQAVPFCSSRRLLLMCRCNASITSNTTAATWHSRTH
ncbi:Transcriptional regulatory protein uhpA [Providencia rustigianii]|nr:Transcriptional regulatory protein uhpA [Providencia rustigianii]